MKKVRIGFIAVALIAICSAFATKPAKKFTVYYAIKTGTTTWTWSQTIPDGYSCQFENGAPVCEVDVAMQPADNTSPSFDDHFYKP